MKAKNEKIHTANLHPKTYKKFVDLCIDQNVHNMQVVRGLLALYADWQISPGEPPRPVRVESNSKWKIFKCVRISVSWDLWDRVRYRAKAENRTINWVARAVINMLISGELTRAQAKYVLEPAKCLPGHTIWHVRQRERSKLKA